MTQGSYWMATGLALAIALVAGLGDWRRMRRRRAIDDIGWVPWRGIQATAFFAALAFFMLALRPF